MPKLFKEKLLTVSTKKIREIGLIVNQSNSILKKLVLPHNLFSFSFFLTIASLIVSLVVQEQLPQKIPMFYSRPWGDEQLADKNFLFLLPIFSLFVTAINLFIAKTFQKKDDFFISGLCGFFSVFFSLITMVSLIKIIALVI